MLGQTIVREFNRQARRFFWFYFTSFGPISLSLGVMLVVARGNCQPWVHHQAFKIPQPREHSLNRDMLPNNGSEGLQSRANIVMETWSVLLTSTAMIKLARCDQLSETSKPFASKTSQESPTLIFYLQYQYIIKKKCYEI